MKWGCAIDKIHNSNDSNQVQHQHQFHALDAETALDGDALCCYIHPIQSESHSHQFSCILCNTIVNWCCFIHESTIEIEEQFDCEL